MPTYPRASVLPGGVVSKPVGRATAIRLARARGDAVLDLLVESAHLPVTAVPVPRRVVRVERDTHSGIFYLDLRRRPATSETR